MTLEATLKRYLSDITPTKKPTTQRGETSKAKKLIKHLGKYSLAALSAEIIAGYRDKCLNEPSHGGTISNNTVRLELALLSHLYTVAIQEWGLGLTFNPVLNIRKPSPGDGRDRRSSRRRATTSKAKLTNGEFFVTQTEWKEGRITTTRDHELGEAGKTGGEVSHGSHPCARQS